MIIMALSYAQKTGDNSHLTQYVNLNVLYTPSVELTSARSRHCWTSGLNSLSLILLFPRTKSALTISRGRWPTRLIWQSRASLASRPCRRSHRGWETLPRAPIILCGYFVHFDCMRRLINLQSIAANYVTRWQTLAASSSGQHLTLAVGAQEFWSLYFLTRPST